MSGIFGKVVRWVICTSLAILGIYCLILANFENSIRPVGVTILSFGTVYLLFRTGASIPRNIGFLTAGVLLVSGALAQFGAEMAKSYGVNLSDYPLVGGEFFWAWWGWTLAIGIPAMAIGFHIFDSE